MVFDFYTYRATVTDVYDADTITCEIELGMYVSVTKKLRLKNIDAPEIRGIEREAGLISRDALREKILNKEVIIKTEKDKTGKYGRYIATIFLPNEDFLTETKNKLVFNNEYININDWLVENKYVEYKEY